MIAFISGRLLESTESSAIILTDGGVGYEIFLTTPCLTALPKRGEVVELYCNTVVREDALELYGFSSWDERETFLILTSINRVGAKTALAILSTFRPDDLRRVVLHDDVAALMRVSGIGKKTSQQLFLELKYKLKVDALPSLAGAAPVPAGGVYNDALDALANLGYDTVATSILVKRLLEEEPDLDVSALLRAALKVLGKGRA